MCHWKALWGTCSPGWAGWAGLQGSDACALELFWPLSYPLGTGAVTAGSGKQARTSYCQGCHVRLLWPLPHVQVAGFQYLPYQFLRNID